MRKKQTTPSLEEELSAIRHEVLALNGEETALPHHLAAAALQGLVDEMNRIKARVKEIPALRRNARIRELGLLITQKEREVVKAQDDARQATAELESAAKEYEERRERFAQLRIRVQQAGIRNSILSQRPTYLRSELQELRLELEKSAAAEIKDAAA